MFLGGFNISHFLSIDPAVSARLVHSPHPHPLFVGLPLHAAFIVGRVMVSLLRRKGLIETTRLGMAEIPTRGLRLRVGKHMMGFNYGGRIGGGH